MGIPARFAVAQRSTAECLGLFAAAQRLFERRGVDFDLVAFETAAERGVEGLIAGEWDYIEIGVIPLVRLRADGHDPAIVVGTTPMNTNFLMGRHDITRVSELAGGRIGCLSLAGQTAAVARAVLARSGVADAVELVPLGKYSKIFDAISAGDIDGAILAGDFRFLGEARHGMRIIADIGSEIRMPGTCVVTTRREIARKPELAKQIVGAYVDAVHIFKTHPDTAKAFLHNHLEFEEGIIERIYEYYRSIFQTRPSLPHIQVAIDDIAKVRPNVYGMTSADLIETRFLNEIETELYTKTAQNRFGSGTSHFARQQSSGRMSALGQKRTSLGVRSLGDKVLARLNQFGAETVVICHFDYAAEVISSFAVIADAECGLRRAVVAAEPLRIVHE